ncbi:NAD(P)-binding domain-containing protein [Streptomyces mutabilis]|uniref:NAD(P)-binding domain-containing protein n=1 Tax=Streptomyces griseiscabiei TaxID=2993540 RepID=A0ABU4LDP6_9ACTN|nr:MULTISPECIES: NAD(P)-binding domain-containing protein [Streptomyces]AHE39944.1 Putative FAD-dependent oxidoreductase [Streptomyces sp. F8]MBZ3908381.1 NAD(P)/FAD-dependent oxidoreductase [Streptomyces griseiscabiei]MDX2913896.1 NAD(P)-binding domain-containing protein [Streptomyces griseiscabiei]
MEHADLIVIGAGQSGLATAALAPRHGFARVLVLESAEEPGGAWPRYYDSLTLFSPARYSSLPGMRFPGDPDRYPRRDEVVDYLRAYAERLPASIHTSTAVASVIRQDGVWRVRSEDGREFTSAAVIAATGDYGTPFLPDIQGRPGFGGRVLHAADYRSPDLFAGQRVIVVGGGNSAIQIAAELGPVADTTLATRRPVGWTPQKPLGRDLHWWLKHTRLDIAPIRRLLAKVPVSVIDDGHYRAALDRHGVDRRDMFSTFTSDGVLWADGAKEDVDTVVFATGYRPVFGYLTGSGALDAAGAPVHRGGLSTTVQGLGFVGMEFQRSFSSKTLRGVGRDAAWLLDRLAAARR